MIAVAITDQLVRLNEIPMQFERIENLPLLENGLQHIEFEISRTQPLYFRAAKEAHLILYRSMVEALRGTANSEITGRPKDKTRTVSYKLGDEPWHEIHKIAVKDCKNAWRYSDPVIVDQPPTMGDINESMQLLDYLQSFYDLLAKIQAKCFMSKCFDSKPINVSDKEMVSLEWLHEEIRNEFEHFIPKLYSVSTSDSIASSILCLKLSLKLIFESRNVIPHDDMSAIEQGLTTVVEQLEQKKSV